MADEIVDDKVIDPIAERDAVNDDVRAAINSLKGDPDGGEGDAGRDGGAAGETVAAVDRPESAADANGRLRGPDGKFAPDPSKGISQENSGAPEEVVAQDQKSPPAESATKPSIEQPSTAAVAAPVSWAADVKVVWPTLPPAVQQAVIKREAEVSAGFAQYSDKTKRYEAMLSPIAQESQKRGLSVEEGAQRLLDGQRFLETQPAQAIMWLAQRHGINLAELASNPPAPQTQVRTDPAPQVIPQLTALEQRLHSIEFGQNLSLTQQFAASKPHYDDVEEFLPDLINEVKAANPNLSPMDLLEKSYERAVWLNPDVRAKVIAAQTAETEQARLAKVHEKSAQAGRAAISIKGSSAHSRPLPKAPSEGNVYDDVRAAIHQVRAG